jgi:sulfofructose kinase
MRFDVIGLGMNATDIAIEVPVYPAFNSKVRFNAARWCAGGQVATSLVVCQRLGLRTKYIGRLGSDPMGHYQLESLQPEGIDLSDAKVVPDCPNQSAFIIVDGRTGERTVLWHRDVRLTMRPEELRREMVTGGRLLHVDAHDNAAAAQAARWAREAGIPVTADVDHIHPGVEELLEAVDYMVSSATFPAAHTGKNDLFEALEEIQRRYPQMKLAGASLGRDGVLALENGRFLYRPAYAVRCRDTTGAGDVFHGAFAYGLLQDWPTERILEFSNAMAALNCRAVGARGGIATEAEAEHLMATGTCHEAPWTEIPPAPGGDPAGNKR